MLRKWEEIAQKHNVPLQTVKDVETSIWKFVREEMEKGIKGQFDTFRNIYLRHLGTFYAHKGKFTNIEKRNDKNNK